MTVGDDVVIRTEALVKDYGTTRALDGLDLTIHRGEVFGFLGPNGAGKSTAIRILLDQLRPTAGRAEVLGSTPREGGPALRARIGYLPGELAMDGRATSQELLEHLARLRGGDGRSRLAVLAERFDLDTSRSIRSLSKGNKQKVGVIQAFMHRPELLILDEPTSGLDPLLQHEFLTLVREAQADGATVFMSSHVLSEVELVAERVAIIRQGRLVDLDDVRTLRRHAGQRVMFAFAGHLEPGDFRALPGLEDIEVVATDDGTTLTGVLRGSPDALLKAAASHRVLRRVLREQRRSLLLWSIAVVAVSAIYASFYDVMDASEMQALIGTMPEGLVAALGYDQLGSAVASSNRPCTRCSVRSCCSSSGSASGRGSWPAPRRTVPWNWN